MNVQRLINNARENAINEHLFLTTCSTRHADPVDHQDDTIDSDTPIIDKIIGESGEEAIPIMINFTTTEFEALWSMVETPLTTQ
ncbi:Aste57867_19849 [Aphanomyces stellatus]|uniref:Aste57867_19849 protein n=1 Tax=Aphanomyces stellatus TaxID=120398 RepID=A0A485LDM0_9STRA|nr:hypothetical protein As57867_019784 [Aphanomyces stellatus]VFT96547.1 Aste57867_19849 [Aphanomyces stellatus]